MPARTAANTYKAAGRQNTAGQVVPELAFHETRDRAVPCLLSGEEGLQLFGDDLIQQRRFWIARPVSVDSHEGIAECTSTRNSLHHRRCFFPKTRRLAPRARIFFRKHDSSRRESSRFSKNIRTCGASPHFPSGMGEEPGTRGGSGI